MAHPMPKPPATPIAQPTLVPDQAYIIHIPGDGRRDRNVETLSKQLRAIGIPRVDVFDGIRPTDAGPMMSIGEWGCYQSHVACLGLAASAPAGSSVMILEDDAVLDVMPEDLVRVLGRASALDWDFLHVGYLDNGFFRSWDRSVGLDEFVEIKGALLGLQSYCVRPEGLAERWEFMAALPDASPLVGGAAGIDGAYCELAWRGPATSRWAPSRSLFRQIAGVKSNLRPSPLPQRAKEMVRSAVVDNKTVRRLAGR